MIDGKAYLDVLRRAEVMETSCLRCHSEAKAAPTGLVDIYGPERSFHRKLGETVSAVSLRIPLSEAYQAADAFSWRLSGILLLVLTALFLAQYALYRRFLLRPLTALQEKAGLIASSASHLGDQIPLPFGRELNGLTGAFNTMSATLRNDRDHLEETVAQRTQDLKVAMDQYRQERNFVDRLLQTAQAIVLLLDADGRIVRVNRYLEELTGYRMEELEGTDWFSTFLPEDDRERTRNVFLNAVGDIETKGKVSPIRTKDGRLRQIAWYDRSLKDEEGHVLGLLCTGVDITERLEAEEARLALERKVQQARKRESLITMAGAIAHHFNNHLQAVMGYLQLAMGELPPDGSASEALIQSMKAAQRAAGVSRQMLAYLGQASGTRESLDLSEICKRTLADLQRDFPENVVLGVDLASPGPPVHVNRNQMGQVVGNLVANAQEAMADTGGTIHVCVRTVSLEDIPLWYRFPVDWEPQEGAYACLEVRDAGPGIPEQDMKRIFDPFFPPSSRVGDWGCPLFWALFTPMAAASWWKAGVERKARSAKRGTRKKMDRPSLCAKDLQAACFGYISPCLRNRSLNRRRMRFQPCPEVARSFWWKTRRMFADWGG